VDLPQGYALADKKACRYVSNSSALRQKDARRVTHHHITIVMNRIKIQLLMACALMALLLFMLVILFAATQRNTEGC
jgi:hypothetical protein